MLLHIAPRSGLPEICPRITAECECVENGLRRKFETPKRCRGIFGGMQNGFQKVTFM